MQLKLTPFFSAVILYLLANTFFLFFVLFNKNLINIEFMYFFVETNILIKALSFQVVALIFLIFLYKSFNLKRMNANRFFESKAGFFLFFWQFIFLVFAMIWGLGVVDTDSSAPHFLVRVSNFISADILYYLIAPSLISRKLFFLNTVLYLVSSIFRGWLGGIVLAFFVYLCRVGYVKISLKSFISFAILFFVLLLISPFLIDMKFLIRTGEEIKFDFTNYGMKLEAAINYLLGRFQHIGHTGVLINQSALYHQLYNEGKILPFWLEGIPQYFLYKLLGNNEVLTFAQTMAVYSFGASASNPWNTNTGISGWFIILHEKSILFVVYWALIIFFIFRFISKYANQQTFNIISVLMIIYLYHGWLGSFFNLIILSFLIIFLKRLKVKGLI